MRDGLPAVDVVIPTYRPSGGLRGLLVRLRQQSVRPRRILLINTGEEFWQPRIAEGMPEVELRHIRKEDFDHAGTRNMGASLADADYVLFMTQDALPADRELVAGLLGAFSDPLVAVSYARQLPKKDCGVIERFTRRFNYPPEGRVKALEDLPDLGIKTFFCSNVCAMYDRSRLLALGGFAEPCIFNEDMVFAGGAVKAGYKVAYVADARVFHSHNYTPAQQFRRNFDNGVSQALHPEVFSGIPSEGEGGRLVAGTARYLLASGHARLLLRLAVHSGAKLAGFKLGRAYRQLPGWLVSFSTMNREFWNRLEGRP